MTSLRGRRTTVPLNPSGESYAQGRRGAGSLQGLARCLPELPVWEYRSNALILKQVMILEQVFLEQVLHMYRARSV